MLGKLTVIWPYSEIVRYGYIHSYDNKHACPRSKLVYMCNVPMEN